MAEFSVSAWFLFEIDVPGDPTSDEYQQALDKITEELESSNAQLFTQFDDYHSDSVVVDWVD